MKRHVLRLLSLALILCMAASLCSVGAAAADGYTAAFAGDAGVASFSVYYTQDYTTPDETGAVSALARSSDTGEVDASGDGQINFAVILKDGYAIDKVSVDGGYKNLKDQGDGIYRITKITSDLAVTVSTTTEEKEEADPYSFTVTNDGIFNSLGEDIGKSLKITAPGTYTVTGQGQTDYANGRIQIQSSGVTVVIRDVRLSYTNGAAINAKYDATIQVEGVNYLTRVIDPVDDPDDDGGKVVKGEYDTGYGGPVSLTFTGSGTLNISAPKKGIGVDVYFDEETHAYNTEVTGSVPLTAAVTVDGPTLNISSAHECIEANVLNLVSGTGSFVSTGDDAVNAGTDADDTDESGGGGRRASALYPYISYSMTDLAINISGGSWYMNSAGDGVDSNGHVTFSGGVTEVYSSTGSDNNPIDYGEEFGGKFTITGGTLLAVGNSAMQHAPDSGNYVYFTGLSIRQGDAITVSDASGTALYTATAPKSANCVLFTSPDVTNGNSYTVTVGTASSTVVAGTGGASGEPGGPGGPGGRPGFNREGWTKSGGYWYYYRGGVMLKGWQLIDGVWYFLNADGSMATGWLYDGAAWYYMESSGAMAEGWLKVSGYWYYFDPASGAMRTGWQLIDGVWYFLYADGSMATGWLYDGAVWYYMESSGAMAEGWLKVSGYWYYFDPASGAMQTGWQLIDGVWYFLYADGSMARSTWLYDGASWYYLYSSGAMAADTTVSGYALGSDGAWIP